MSNQDLSQFRPEYRNDEINLGELIRNIISQWKLIVGITLLGSVLSVIYAISQPKIYKVSTLTTMPTLEQLGEATTQNLIGLSSSKAYVKFLDQISSYQVKQQVFNQSELLHELAKNSEVQENLNLHLLNQVLEGFHVERLKRDYVELKDGETAPLLDVAIELESQYPEQASNFLNHLVETANNLARKEFETELAKVKAERIANLSIKVEQLTDAEQKIRQAQISRIEEKNALEIIKLEQSIQLALEKSKRDRLNRITVLEDALKVAKSLNIENPTTWEAMRGTINNSQITNQIVDKNQATPLYFQGSRVLSAEIARLKGITNDESYVSSITTYRNQIKAIKNDPVLADLKNREEDVLYIDGLNSIIKEFSNIETEITKVPSTLFVNVLAPAITPNSPIKPNKALIAVAGTVLAGFFGLFLALMRIAIKKD